MFKDLHHQQEPMRDLLCNDNKRSRITPSYPLTSSKTHITHLVCPFQTFRPNTCFKKGLCSHTDVVESFLKQTQHLCCTVYSDHRAPERKTKWVTSVGTMTLLHVPPPSYKHQYPVMLLTATDPVCPYILSAWTGP